jgi:hypothetical protein
MKIYKIAFNEYSHITPKAVSNGETEIGKVKYIDCGESCLIREEDIPACMKWGGGISSLTYVGDLSEEFMKLTSPTFS